MLSAVLYRGDYGRLGNVFGFLFGSGCVKTRGEGGEFILWRAVSVRAAIGVFGSCSLPISGCFDREPQGVRPRGFEGEPVLLSLVPGRVCGVVVLGPRGLGRELAAHGQAVDHGLCVVTAIELDYPLRDTVVVYISPRAIGFPAPGHRQYPLSSGRGTSDCCTLPEVCGPALTAP